MIAIIRVRFDMGYRLTGACKPRESPMAKFPWKTTLAAGAVLALTAYAYAQMSSGPMGMHGPMQQGGMNGPMSQMHEQMMQGRTSAGMHGGMGQGMQGNMGMHGQASGASATPTLPGQDAFGAIQEVVGVLQADPSTDWSKVNIEALRQHLIDMNEVTLHAVAAQRDLDDGVEITVTGQGRTLEAIKRMVPAHVGELREIGWRASSEDLPNGVKLTVRASEAHPLTRLKALGFMGVMVQGGHHQPHHLAMAKGEFPMH
jgi:hypothetical protein